MGKRTPQEEMHAFLTGDDRASALMRRVFTHVPSGPNCKICAAPFAGPGGAVLRHLGFGRYAGNPTMCNFCIKSLQRQGVQGAEIPVSLLFADLLYRRVEQPMIAFGKRVSRRGAPGATPGSVSPVDGAPVPDRAREPVAALR